MMYGYIYKTINLVNDKIYIGQHKSSIFDPEYCGSGKYLRNAVKKYGRVNFYVELLERCDSKEILNEREKYYIAKYNSRDSSIGYNIAYGGEGGDLVSCLPEKEHQIFVDMMADMNRRGIIGNKGKRLSESHRKKISKSNIGKVRSKESNAKQSASMKGKKPWNKGLTADDPRVARHIHKVGEYHHSEATRLKISQNIKHRENMGKYIKTEAHKQKLRDRAKGRIWINNGDVCKMIYPDELDTYINIGYMKGRGKLK